MTPDETPIENEGLARKTALVVAAIRLGYVSHEYAHDLMHPEVGKAQARFEETTQAMERWMAAVDVTFPRAVGFGAGGALSRVGNPSRVLIADEATDADAGGQCRNGTTSQGA